MPVTKLSLFDRLFGPRRWTGFRLWPWFVRFRVTPIYSYALAVFFILVCTLFKGLLGKLIGHQAPFLILFTGIFLSARYGGMRSGVTATLFAGILAFFFYLENDVVGATLGSRTVQTILFLGEGIFISWLFADRDRDERQIDFQTHLLTNVHDAINAVDQRGIITYWNQGAERLYGFPAREVIGRHIQEVTHFEWMHPKDEQDFRSTVDQTGHWSGQIVHYKKNGERMILEISFTKVTRRMKDQTALVAVLHNVTDRILQEEEKNALADQLAQQRERIDNVIAKVPGVVWEAWGQPAADKQRINFVSQYVQTLLGYSVEEWLNTPNFWLTIVHPADRERAAKEADDIFNGGVGGVSRFRWVKKNGQIIWVEAQSVVVKDRKGKPIGMRGVTMDITDRMRDEEDTRKSKEQLDIILQNVTEGITVQDPSGNIIFANDTAAQIIGFTTARELLTTPVREIMQKFDILDENGQPFPIEQLPSRRALAGEQVDETLVRYRIKDTGQERWSILKAVPVLDKKNKVLFALNIFNDITERKRSEISNEFLAKASELLATSLDFRETMEQIARLAVPRIADWCTVDFLGQDGVAQRLAVAHQDPAKVKLAQDLQKKYPADPNAPTGFYSIIKTGRAVVYPVITHEMIRAAVQDKDMVDMLLSIGFSSSMAIPLKVRGETKGVVTFVMSESGRHFSEADQRVAEDLTRRAGLAIENSQLYHEVKEVARRNEESLALLDTLQGSAPIGIAFYDVELKIERVNDALARMHGYPAADHLGKTMDELLPDVAGTIQPLLLTVLETRRPIIDRQIEAVTPASPGRLRYWQASYYPVITPDGEIQGVGAIVIDMTERKLAEEALRASEEHFRALVEGVRDYAIVMLDPGGHVISWNEGAERIKGFKAADIIGKNFSIFYPKEDVRAGLPAKVLREATLEGRTEQEGWRIRQNGEKYLANVVITALHDERGRLRGFAKITRDVTERRQAEDMIKHQAYHDNLTNLPNRMLLEDRMKVSLEHARRNNEKIAILFLDLDRFKNINDSLGHRVGDLLLKQVSKRLSTCVRKEDTIARLGGDEFMILLTQIHEAEDAIHVADKILGALSKNFVIGGSQLHVSGSIGIAMYPDDGRNVDTLLKNADTALYRVKESGRNGYRLYAQMMSIKASEKLRLENQLREAIRKDELSLYYQPIINVKTSEIVSMEALIRWQHPTYGLLMPGEFIPLAEETGLILPLGEFVLRTACQQAKAWANEGHPVRVAVNLSAQQFSKTGFLKKIRRALDDAQLDPKYLELEITETIAMQNVEYIVKTMKELQTMGIHVTIDDFGTGHSSLSYLRRFPINTIKIDQSFIKNITTNADDAVIIKAIVFLAQNLKLDVIAEGVETPEQINYLVSLGCQNMQGYYFSVPVPPEQYLELAKNGIQKKEIVNVPTA